MEKYHLYNQYVLNLFEKRFAFEGPEASSGATASEDVPTDAEKADADKEKTEPAKEGPTPSADEAKRNMTRTHAKRVSDRLKTMDDAAKKLAEEIDAAYSESVTAEVSHDKDGIASATNTLRSKLLSGEAILNEKGAERSSAEKYAQRELGLEEEIEKKKNMDAAKGGAKKAEKELTDEVKDEDAKNKILTSTKSVKDEAKAAESELKYEVATQKYTEYAAKLRAEIKKASESTEKTPEIQAKSARKAAQDKLKELVKEGADAAKLTEAGRTSFETADVEFTRSNFTEAKKLYEQAKNDYVAAAPGLTSATAETDEALVSVDVQKVLGKLQGALANAIHSKGSGMFNGSEYLPAEGVVAELKGAFDALNPTEKKAVAGSAVNYITTNPKNRKEGWVITAQLFRSGDVAIAGTKVERETDSDLNDTERSALLNQATEGSPVKLSEAGEARNKSPEEVNGLVESAIDASVKQWAEKGQADDRVLKKYIEIAIESVKKNLTPEEWNTCNINTGLQRVPGTTLDWEYSVKIKNGNLDVFTD